MCGRVAVYRTVDVLAETFDARVAAGAADRYEPGYNLAPTRTLPGLVDEGGRVLDLFHWGFANRSFNVRGERVSGTGRRVAVVVDGFFEWHEKRPQFFVRSDGAPLALAGLLESHSSSCSMVTTWATGGDLEGIHDRMPVVLGHDALAAWLSHDELGRHQLAGIVRPAPRGTLAHHSVDPRVGDVRNDTPDLVAPFEPPVQPLRLFG